MTTISNHYFKDDGDRQGQLISGLPLPLNSEGKLTNIRFVDCTFHPCCDWMKKVIEGCEFIRCGGMDHYEWFRQLNQW